MKKLLLIPIGLLSSATILAMSVNQPIGASFTLGNMPNQWALVTSLSNPAAPYFMVSDGSFRSGTLGPLSIGIEIGAVSDLEDQVENLEKIVDANYVDFADAKNGVSEANALLAEIGDDAYVKTSLNMQLPFMPIIYKTRNSGAFMLDANLSVIGKGSLLAGTFLRIGNELITDTSFYAQTATDFSVGVGYSQSIWENSRGMWVGGIKANLHQMSLGRALVELDDKDNDAADAISNTISDDSVSSTGVGVDLGIIWMSHHFQSGLTLANLNEPVFKKPSIIQNGSSYTYGITESSSYTMEMQATIDAAISTLSKRWMLGVSYDLNSVEDAVEDRYQWATASLSYYGSSQVFPGIRIGFRKNLAGSELSYSSVGLTFSQHLNLDVAVALDKIDDDNGDETPRSYYVALGYNASF
ncbi:conjugal transfer protein TraF [Marinomonas sp. 2405UD66-6]|uniref:conjugal transfer protein TraF n=1 Tax=Marinomonas sp. 2405UD66-6 TaxID=3391834 RepID=UPI0039C9A9E8